MHVYRYGIVVLQNRDNSDEWRIAIIDGPVADHTFIDVYSNVFNYQPSLGDSVKIKLEDSSRNDPTEVSKCASFEWIRDVEVVDSKVVIFIISRFSTNSLQQSYRRENSELSEYIIENDDTDLQRFSILEDVLNDVLSKRSPLQKSDEPIMYRVGVCWSSTVFENGVRTNWRHYQDFPVVPIFELYYRETVLPYLSEAMIYGVLDGIVVMTNGEDVLFWTPQMGCAVLSSVTRNTQMPVLGSVHHVLAKRCISDRSFGFPCAYELLPGTKSMTWDGIRIARDEKNNRVYIEAQCECSRLSERRRTHYCMTVPNIGKVWRGLEEYRERISSGEKYYIRVDFEIVNDTCVPIVRDLCLQDDQFVDCRIVHISKKTNSYFAILEPRSPGFHQFKEYIDFVVIPFRVLFSAKGVHVEPGDVLKSCLKVRVRCPRNAHDIVDAVHVLEIFECPADADLFAMNGSVWLRTLALVHDRRSDAVVLICPRLQQQIIDFGGFSDAAPAGHEFAVQAQFTLSAENVPMFVVRHAAQTTSQLPVVDEAVAASLPPLSIPTSSSAEQVNAENDAPDLPSSSKHNSHPNSHSGSMDELSTILDESEFERRNRRGSSSSFSEFSDPVNQVSRAGSYYVDTETTTSELSLGRQDFGGDNVATDSMIASSVSGMTLKTMSTAPSVVSMDEDFRCEAEVITESFADSISDVSDDSSEAGSVLKVSSTPGSGSGKQQRPSLFAYKMNEASRPRSSAGFGSPSNSRRNTYPNQHRRRKPVKHGVRQLSFVANHAQVLEEMAEHYKDNRVMFVENEHQAVNSWFRRPTATVVKSKERSVMVYAVEKVDYSGDRQQGHCQFDALIRFFVVKGDVELVDSSVVIPVGGRFPEMPKGFQLGDLFRVIHFSFPTDRMCRISGFAEALNELHLYRPCDQDIALFNVKTLETVENRRGHEYLRFRVKAIRSSVPEFRSDVFELWLSSDISGYIIVKKTPELMKVLEELQPDVYHRDIYSIVAEPLAGGPMEISLLKSEKFASEPYVMWRMVTEFSETVPLPELVERNKIRPPPVEYPIDPSKFTPIKDYGCWKTMAFNSQLHQERMDRLRALGDPRIKWLDGPDLKPEIEVRKVPVDVRRENMFLTMEAFLSVIPKLHELGMLEDVTEEEFATEMNTIKLWDDEHHPHQFRKRTRSLEVGINYICDLILNDTLYKALNETEETKTLIRMIGDTLGLNSTYLRQTNQVKKMLSYFYKHKLNPYI